MKQLGNREYWPIEKAAKFLGSTADELIHAGALGRIQLCINVFRMGEEVDACKMIRPFQSKDYGWEDPEDQISAAFEKAQLMHWQRSTVEMPEGIYELAYDDARRLEVSVDNSITLEWGERFDGHDWWLVKFGPSIKVSGQHIVVRQEELVKFKDGASEARPTIDSREQTANLNVIGMLVHMLRNRAGKDLSEAALIQNLLTTEMRLRSDPNARPPYGLSERSLQEKFKNARQSLSMAGVNMARADTCSESAGIRNE